MKYEDEEHLMSVQASSQQTETRHRGPQSGAKRGVLAAAVALCCVLGIGTAVAASAVPQEGTTAPSGGSEALQTAAYDADGTVQTLAADTPAVIDDEDHSATEIVMDFSKAPEDELQPTLHLDLYEGVTVTVNWGDGNSQTATHEDGDKHSPNLGDGSDPSLYAVDVTKSEPYAAATNPDSDDGSYTITISASAGTSPAYLLGQGIGEQAGYDTWYVGLLNQGQPLDEKGNKQGEPEEVYGHYLVSVTTAANAGIQADSFFGAQTDSKNNDYDLFTKADFSHCDTSSVCDMEYSFANCFSLETIDVSGFDTSNVREMKHMFANCAALTELDLTNWNTSQVTTMHEMCNGCSSLASFTLGDGWDTGEVVNMHDMFNGCKKLTGLDVSTWNTGKVTNMENMFYSCSNSAFKELDVSNWNVSSVTDMKYMFYNCSNLTTLDVSKWDVSSVTTMYGMFESCSNLTTLDVSNWNTSSVTNFQEMFMQCKALTSLDVSNWETGVASSICDIFDSCSKLTTLGEKNVSDWDVSASSNNARIFKDCPLLTEVDVSKWSFSSKNISLYQVFYNCSSLTELDVSAWNTGSIQTCYQTFYGCSKLTTLGEKNVSDWDVSNVTNMESTFQNCSSLTDLDVSNWNTAKVTTMKSMFYGCSSLTELSFANWDTAKVTNTSNRSNLLSGDTSLRKVTLGANFQLYASDLPTPNFSSPYKATGEWQELLDEDTGTFGEPMGTAAISKERETDEEVWYASMATLQQEWFEVETPVDATGSPITPTITITTAGSAEGVTDTDYTISYEDENGNPVESIVSGGTYKVVLTGTGSLIEGKGNYTGSVSYELVVAEEMLDTEIVMNFTDSENLQPTLHLDLYKNASVTVNWGDGTSQTASYSSGSEHEPSLGEDEDPSLYAVDVTKTEPYAEAINPDNTDDGTYTITISAGVGMSPAYLLGQGIAAQAGFSTDYTSLLNQGKPYDSEGKQQGDSDEVYGHYLVSVTTAPNAGVQADSFYAAKSGDYDQFTEADFSSCDTTMVRDMEYMFVNCDALTTINMSGFDTSQVKEMKHMFDGCSKLTTLDFSNFDTQKVTTMHYLCSGCSSLASVTFGDGWNTSQVEEMHYMFNSCSSLTALDVKDWNTSKVTTMDNMFDGCSGFTTLDLSGWITPYYTNMEYMFRNCSKLATVDVSGFKTGDDGQSEETSSTANMFYNCTVLEALDVSKWNTSNVSNMASMFSGCNALAVLDVSDWDTSSVTNMANLFRSCMNLDGLDVSEWDVSAVTTLSYAFYDCRELTELDVSDWETSEVTNMERLFYDCQKLTTLEVSDWDTAKVTTLNSTFSQCTNLTELDVSGWDTAKVTTIGSTFNQCKSLEELSFANWNTEKVTSRSNFLSSDTKLRKVTLGKNFELQASDLPTPNFSSPYKATGEWQELLDKDTGTFGEPTASADISKEQGTDEEVWYASMATLQQGWFEVASPVICTGSPVTPTITITEAGSTEGVTDTDYTISYQDADGNPIDEVVDPGTYTIILTGTGSLIEGKGNYTGSVSYEFEVIDKIVDTTIVMNFKGMDDGVPQPTLHLDLYENATVTIDWGDESDEQTVSYSDGSAHSGKSGLYTVDVEKDAAYEQATNPNSSDGSYTITISASAGTSPAYLLGQGASAVDKWTSLLETTDDQTYGAYLVSVTTAENAGIQSDSFHGTSDDSYPLFTTAGFSECNTSEVTELDYAFNYCAALTTVDVSGLDTAQVTSLSHMFNGCAALESLVASTTDTAWDTSKVTTTSNMFHNCSNLTSVDLSGWNISSLTNMQAMFADCKALESLDLATVDGSWDTSNVTDMGYLFASCEKLKELTLTGWNTSSVTDMQYMFYECKALTDESVATIPGWNTESVTTMSRMFYDCQALTSLEIPKTDAAWNTGKVTDMDRMFAHCTALTSLDVTGWDTSSVEDMAAMFYNCEALTEIDVSGFDTTSATTLQFMFENCTALETLGEDNVSNWDTSNVTVLARMFCGCNALQEVDVSGFDTAQVTNMNRMFENCWALTELSFENWDSANIVTRGSIMLNDTHLRKVTLGENFELKNVDPDMPTPDFTEPYTATGKWQQLLDEDTKTFGDPTDPADITKAQGSEQEVWYASMYVIEEDWFEITNNPSIYTGSAITPDIQFTEKVPEGFALDGDDCSVTYYDPSGEETSVDKIIDAGTYTIVITGNGDLIDATPDYTGEVTLTFTIDKLSLELEWWDENHSGATVDGDVSGGLISFVYDGVASDVQAQIIDLPVGVDCDVTVTGGIETAVGVHVATASLSNPNCQLSSGFPYCHYYIEHYTITKDLFTVEPLSETYRGEAIVPTVVGTFMTGDDKEYEMTEGTDYTVTYYVEGDDGKPTGDPVEMVGVGDYIVVIEGMGNFNGKIEYEFTVEQAVATPENHPETDGFTATYGDTLASLSEQLSAFDDDCGSWSWADEAETTFVGSVGENAFTAVYTPVDETDYVPYSCDVPVTVVEKSIIGMGFEYESESAEYTGYALTPHITVPNDPVTGEAMVEGVDYELKFYKDGVEADPIGVGTYTFTITGIGNYADTLQDDMVYTFEITQAEPDVHNIPSGLTATYGDTLASVILPQSSDADDAWGWEWSDTYDENTLVGDVGVQSFEAVFRPADEEDYDDESYSVEINVSPKPVELTWTETAHEDVSTTEDGPFEWTYDGVAANLTATVDANSLVGEDTCGVVEYEKGSNTQKVAGSHLAVATVLDDGNDDCNYTLTGSHTATCFYYIEHAQLVIVPNDASKVYGEADPELTGTAVGLVEGDALDITYQREDTSEDVGTYVITASCDKTAGDAANYIIAVETASFFIDRADISGMDWTFDTTDETYTSQEITKDIGAPNDLVTGATLVENVDYTVYYTHNVDVGTATILVTGTGNYSGIVVSAFDITPAAVTITCTDAEKTYGAADPELTGEIDGLFDSDTLEVTYSREEGEDVGEYTITADYVENANYKVTVVDAVFTITRSELNDDDFDVTIENEGTFTYTASAIEPAITVTVDGTELVEGTDYTVAYGNNVDVTDAATITITGIGNYDGSITKEFSITPAPVTITCADAEKTYGEEDPAFTGTIEGLLGDDTLEVTYKREDTGEDAGTYDITASYDANPNYDVSVTDGTFTIKAKELSDKDFDITLANGPFVYSGEAFSPEVTVKVGGIELSKDTDYTVEYSNNVNAGTATVTVSAVETSNYAGSVTLEFTIDRAPVELTWTSNIPDAESTFNRGYDGTPLTVSATVTSGLVDVDSGKTFTVTIDNPSNSEVGVYMANATGLEGEGSDNYSISGSSAHRAYSIETAQLTTEMFDVYDSDKEYTDAGVEVAGLVKVADEASPKPTENDYVVTCTDEAGDEVETATDIGSYTITITGTGNFGGTLTYTFDIIQITPEYTVPTGLTATYGDKLSAVKGFPTDPDNNGGTWSWAADADATFVGDAGTQVIDAVYTPADPVHYATVTEGLTVEVEQLSISDKGDEFELGAGSASYTGRVNTREITAPDDPVTGEEMVEGVDYEVTYYKLDDEDNPGTDPVEPKGVGKYVFTITGIGNYKDSLENEEYTFEIVAAQVSGTLAPTNLTATYGETLGDVTLPRSSDLDDSYGWAWDPVEGTPAEDYYFTGADEFQFSATYTPADTSAESAVTQNLTVTVASKAVELIWDQTSHPDATNPDGTYDWIYDGVAADLSATVDPASLAFEEDAATCTVKTTTGNTEKAAGMHVARVTELNDPNYTIDGVTSATCFYYIEHAAATIVVNDATKTYGKDDPTFSGTAKDFVPADEEALDIQYVRANDDESAGTHTGAITASYDTTSGIADNYTITVTTGTLVIERATLESMGSKDDWKVDTEDERYTGVEITKDVTAPAGLTEGTDYTVTYFNNRDVGTATITVTGCGNYTGLLTWDFKITTATITITCDDASKTYGETDQAFSYTVDPAEDEALLGTIVCSRESGEDAGTYEITASYDTNANCEVTVHTATFTIKAKDLVDGMFNVDAGPFDYTGSVIMPKIYGVDGSKGLNEGIDYSVTVKNESDQEVEPIEAGTYTITITGIGNYQGSVTRTFVIGSTALSSTMFDFIVDSDTYTGYDIGTTVVPRNEGGVTITEDDYDVTLYYGDDKVEAVHDAGTYTILVTASETAAFNGSCSYTFTIAPATVGLEWADEAHPDVPYADGLISFTYDGKAANVTATVTGLLADDDCTATVEGGTEGDVGIHTATATALSNPNYQLPDQDYCTYYIEAATIDDSMFDVDTADKEYTGSQITPPVESSTLKEGTDYTVTYGVNTELGIGTITIEGIGNYTGRVTFRFNITQETPKPAHEIPEATNFAATYGDTLGSLGLADYNEDDENGSWSWVDGDETFVGAVGPNTFTVLYTPTDTDHFATITTTVTVTVSPLDISTMDPGFVVNALETEYTGYAIDGDITAPNDPVTDASMVAGSDYQVTYYDENDDETTPVHVGSYTFTIAGEGNFCGTLPLEEEEESYTLTINKADPQAHLVPTSLTATYGQQLEDIILPKSSGDADAYGWDWDEDQTDEEEIDATHHFTHVGTYSYHATYTPEDPDDVESTHAEVEVTILPKTVDLIWTDDPSESTFVRTYDGQPSAVSATVDPDSLAFESDECTVDVEGGTEANAGAHVATASLDEANDVDENYTLEGSSTTTCAYYIDRAAATITADNATKAYGVSDPSFTYTTSDFVGNDADELGITCVRTDTDESAGTHVGVITATYDEDSEAAGNYIITVQPGNLTITSGTFSSDDPGWVIDTNGETYDGQPKTKRISAPSGMTVDVDYTVTYVNNVNAGVATIVITGTGNYSGTIVATFTINKADASAVTPTDLTATYSDALGTVELPEGWTWNEDVTAAVGDVPSQTHAAIYTPADTANYKTVSADLTVTIAPKQITDEMFDIDTEDTVYTGYPITKYILGADGSSYLKPATDYTVTYTREGGQATDSAQEAGTYTITITGIGNYTGTVEATFTVTQAAPPKTTYTEPTGITATYGDTLADVALPSGWTWDDEGTTPVGGAGKNTFNATYTPDDDNYASVTEELIITVAPKALELEWSGDKTSEYDGTEKTVTATVNASDLVGNDSCEVSVAGGNEKNAGAYTATATLDNANYTPTNDTFAYAIEHRTITVKASDVSKTVGTELPTLPVRIANLVESDAGALTATASAPDWNAATEQAGDTYQIVPSYVWSDESVAANYDVQAINGQLKIVSYDIPNGLEGTYGDTLADVALPSGWTWDDPSEQLLDAAGSTHTYPATYDAETDNIAVTIVARTVTLSWADAADPDGVGRTYDGKASAVSATAGNLVSGDTCAVTVEGGDAVDAGRHTATATALSNANYALPADATYVYHIERASAVIAVDDATKVKGAADPKLTGHVDGLVAEGDLGDITYTRAAGENVGTYRIDATYTANANYTVTVEPGTFTITAATTKKDDSLHVGDTFWYNDGQYTVTSLTTARYNWPRATTTKANVATTIHRGGLTLNVTKIKKTAFKNRTKLTVIKIGDHVKKIPNKEFKGCKNVTKIVLGKDVKTIGKASAKGLKKLKKVNVKSTKLKKIAAKAFQNDKKLKTVKIKSKKLKTIGKLAFAGCKKLKKMNLKSKKLKKIGAKAFKGDKKLKKFVAKSPKLKKIGKKCFKGCKKLKAITLKSKKLKAKGVKKALKGSKIKLIKTSTSTKKTRALNKKLRKLYKKDFKKKNSGRKVKVQ